MKLFSRYDFTFSSLAPGWHQIVLFFKIEAFFSSICNVISGFTTKFTISKSSFISLKLLCALMPSISFSFGFTGITLCHFFIKSLSIMFPYFSLSFDAQIITTFIFYLLVLNLFSFLISFSNTLFL